MIARMLGLNINNLAVPDYEIIARLEKLILAHQSGVITDAAIGTIVDDMEEGFRYVLNTKLLWAPFNFFCYKLSNLIPTLRSFNNNRIF